MHDGFRILARRDATGERQITRAGNNFSSRFPFIAMVVGKLPVRSCLIDGEAIICDENGLAVFELIRRHSALASAVHCAFDLLELDGEDLRPEPNRRTKGVTREVAPRLTFEHRLQRAFRGGRRDCLPRGVQPRLRRHRVKAAWLALSLGAVSALSQSQKSEGTGSKTRSRRGLGPIGSAGL